MVAARGPLKWERKMRSQMTRLTVAALLVCCALVFTSDAWAWPVSGPASTRAQESPLIENLVDWVLSLIGRHSISPQSPAPDPPRNQPKEGSQMDPNGSPH
jgi:hypothetical protein